MCGCGWSDPGAPALKLHMTDRSNMARTYLASQGFEVKYLQGGLLGLMNRLKGGAAKKIKLEKESHNE